MGPLSFPLLICVALAFSQASSQVTLCKDNFQEFEGSCYFLSDVADTWLGGKHKCASHGGNLVSIQSERENKYVRSLVQDNVAVWIGGYEYKATKSASLKWRWTDGQQMNYTNWDRGQPRDFPRKAVMMMFADGTWGNEYYTEKFNFVCEEHPVPACEEGYYLHDSNCYVFREEKLGFREAQKNCSGDGGNLASVHSDESNEVLISLAGDSLAWIGGYKDPEKDVGWQWSDGTPFDYQQWAEGQPAEIPNNICILMNYPDESKTGWSNELCGFAYGYVCQKPQKQP